MTPAEAAEVILFADAVRLRSERPAHQLQHYAAVWAPYLDGVTYDDCRKAIEDLSLNRVGDPKRRPDDVFHIAARARHHAAARESDDRAKRARMAGIRS